MPRPCVCRVSAAAMLIAVLAGCSSQAEVAEPPRVARVAQVEAANAQAIAVYPGEIHARFESALGFRVGGKIRARHVDVGSHVIRDQVLAELDPQDLELARSSARASLASAQAAYQLANSEHERYQTLHKRNFVSQFDLEAKTNALAAASAHVAEARAALDAASNQAAYAGLRADSDGVITAISSEVGQVVGTGQPVMTLAHDGASEVEINVPEQAIADLQVGGPAQIELWTDSGRRGDGSIREIAPSADATTRTYRVRVAFADESAKPRLGQTARVYFVSRDSEDRFLVPLSAIYEKDGTPALWQVDPGTRKVHLASIDVEKYGETEALVGDGLSAQAWIVTAGVHRLREGEVINPIDALNKSVNF